MRSLWFEGSASKYCYCASTSLLTTFRISLPDAGLTQDVTGIELRSSNLFLEGFYESTAREFHDNFVKYFASL